MANYIIDLGEQDGNPFSIDLELSGVQFAMDFDWNPRLDPNGWFFHFYDSGRAPLLLGRYIVPNYNVLARLTDQRKPAGRLYFWDSSGRGELPGPLDLGARVKLVYDDLL